MDEYVIINVLNEKKMVLEKNVVFMHALFGKKTLWFSYVLAHFVVLFVDIHYNLDTRWIHREV